MATVLNGKAVSKRMKAEVKAAVAEMVAAGNRPPGLATVLVGGDPASSYYVRSKHRACKRAGIVSIGHELPEETTQEELEALVAQLNADENVDGILVQLPLPRQLDADSIIDMIRTDKDVDGFNPLNIASIAMRGRMPDFVPATPYGIMVLLKETGVPISGKNAVVLGRSNIVGMPIALLLTEANATVTICHSRTKDLDDHLSRADIVVAAVGRPNYVKGSQLKPGCVVIDVGINQVDDDSTEKGYKLVGDVEYDSAFEVASHITPVPGGVGPMTIAMLLKNTLKAAQSRQ